MRKQRALAGLTEREIEQIADWLRARGPDSTYDAIRARIAKPRPEGFALTISNKPLQLLWEKTNRVERINNRIASGQRLSLAEFDAIQAGEKADVAEEIHDAIMDETHAMATSGENTPTQLLALQRLADFPARAEYRAQRAELEAQKQAHKVQMDLQKSAHQMQMDLEKAAQKKEMDEHRKRMAEERLALAKRSLDLREKQLAAKSASSESAIRNPQSAMSDDLGPLATTYEEIRARARAKFGSYKNGRNRGHETHETSGSCEPSLPSRPSVETPASSPGSDPCSSVPSAVKNSSSAFSESSVVNGSSSFPPLPPVEPSSSASFSVGSVLSVVNPESVSPVSAPSAPLHEINVLPVTNTNNDMNHPQPQTYETDTALTQSPGTP